MYKKKKIAVVIPCYNEETQIEKVVETLPKYVDKIVIVDDKSKDKTAKIIKSIASREKKVLAIYHSKNSGVGASIASGYKWCRDSDIDVAAVMAGDGQMLPKDLQAILDPVVDEKADYSKANRLISGRAFEKMPKIRYFGNSILSFLTKIASGYWHVMDSQTGYTAINKNMLALIDWDSMYRRYGQPNDLLVRLNVYAARVKDVPLEPVYKVGERSGIRIQKVFFTIPIMLIRLFFWRLKEKYIIRDFHPLVLFYFFGIFMGIVSIIFFVRVIYLWPILGQVPSTSFLAWMFSTITSAQFTMFAMWFDMDYNKDLRVK